ncbi:hypothetical protein SLS62_004579 [Diatrype stigma]|uniref:Uncharacterized protein n=1 Tax=Diatrype stigma TaxID=117547 RepID=A0AAN9UQM8_9PEZI
MVCERDQNKMAGKHDSAEPSWRPLAQKLSGFMKHSSAKPKKAPETTTVDEKSSVFKFKRQKKTSSPETAPHFEPLEVDVDILEAFRLSEGWLETNTRNPADQKRDPNRNQSGEQQRPPDRSNSSTPIGDMFAAKKSALIASDSAELGRSGSHNHNRSSSRPFSMLETEISTYGRASPDSSRDGSATGSILDRGRPVEPRRYVTDPLVKTKSLKQELAEAAEAAASASSAQQLQAPKTVDTSKRHSMYAGVTPSLNNIPTRTKPVQAPTTSTSAVPVDRIKTWQKSVTSAPMGPPPPPSTSLNPGLSSSAAAGSVRKVSPRGMTGNRLAWIRELEEKKSSAASQNAAPGPKKLGSVSDRLAMFEQKQAGLAGASASASSSASRLPPSSSLTRSNSTVSTSRLSSTGLESVSSAYGGRGDNGSVAATPRTSIDTVRSSHRASSVLSYYDESFRGKMESIVGDYDKDKADAQKKQRVTTQFVPVKGEKEGLQSQQQQQQQPEAGASTTTEVKKDEVEPQTQPQPEAGLSNTEPENEKDTKEVIQVDAGASNTESEEEKGEDLPSLRTTDADTEKNITINEA